jgi:uncharacterized protein YndB with AHSA1/START domain
MTQLEFAIDIHAPREVVWEILWGEESFRDWTSAFAPGSTISADWREGGRFEFTDSSGGVSYGVLEEHQPGARVHFSHVAEILDGRETTFADGPRREIYTLEERGGATRLLLLQNVPEELGEMFEEATPRAFARIKELSEAHAAPQRR